VLRALFCLLMLLAAGLAGPVEARRVALVVGIDNYQQVEKLSRARNDAAAIAAQLSTAGFEVILRTDPDRRTLSVALSEFEDRLRGAEVGMFFFAGHGVEIRGTNVLLPADIPSTLSETIILREGLLLTDLAQTMSDAGVRYSALIIDACRDNPLPRQAGRSTGRTRGLGRADAPRGTYVVYSAGIGEAALDRLSDADLSPNSVFTRHLLPALAEPGVSLDAAVKQVRERVRADAALVRHAQNPAIYDQATGELYLVPSAPRPEAPPAAAAPSVALPPPPGGADATEMLFWQSVQLHGQAPELEAYLARWPDGIFAPIARARLAALAAPPPAPPRSLPAPALVPLARDGIQQLQRGWPASDWIPARRMARRGRGRRRRSGLSRRPPGCRWMARPRNPCCNASATGRRPGQGSWRGGWRRRRRACSRRATPQRRCGCWRSGPGWRRRMRRSG
jgi:uncharacterized caspase-like protein